MTSERGARIDAATSGSATVVTIAGEVDIYSSPVVRERVLELIDGRPKVVLDFRDVTFIDSTGVAVFIAARRQAEQQSTELTVRASGQVHKVLEMVGLTKYLTLENGDTSL